MRCQFCGKQLKSGVKFCTSCGHAIESPETLTGKAAIKKERLQKSTPRARRAVLFAVLCAVLLAASAGALLWSRVEAPVQADWQEKRSRPLKVNSLLVKDVGEPISDEQRLYISFEQIREEEQELYFFYDDFDADGVCEAYGVTGSGTQQEGYTNVHIYFITSDGTAFCVNPNDPLYGDLTTDQLYFVEGKKFLLWEKSAGGSESTTYIYGVKNGSAYEPEISGQYMCFGTSLAYMGITDEEQPDNSYVGFTPEFSEGGHDYTPVYFTFDAESSEFLPVADAPKDHDTVIEEIRTIYYDIQASLDQLTAKDGGAGTTRYVDASNVIRKIVAPSGTYDFGTYPWTEGYSAEYYYDQNERLVFVFAFRGTEEYRFYLSDGKLIRYIDPDGTISDYAEPVDPSAVSPLGGFCTLGMLEIHWANG